MSRCGHCVRMPGGVPVRPAPGRVERRGGGRVRGEAAAGMAMRARYGPSMSGCSRRAQGLVAGDSYLDEALDGFSGYIAAAHNGFHVSRDVG